MPRTVTATALATLLLPALASGQEPVKSFDQLNTRLKVGDKIVVTDTRGGEHKGKLLELSASALTLDDHGLQKYAMGDVQLVEERQRDSLKNGALIGLATGAALAGGVIATSCGEGYCENEGAFMALGLGFYAGVGAAIGTGIDALIPGKRQVVYRAPYGEPATRAMLMPVITPRTKGVALSLSF